jgi:NarL family two-component system response regulator LiaR
MNKIRILVVDDQTVVREGMVAILSLQPDMEVVGEAENGIEAVHLARKTKPDVILLDMVMPLQDGLATIPKLKDISPNVRILVLTSFAESDRVYQAIKTGALGYMLKDTPRPELLKAIREVAQGQASLHPSIAIQVIKDFNSRPVTPASNTAFSEHLTRRELETLKLIARGLSNQEIALTLVVNERTIAKYVSSVLNKLHLANRTQAALYAIREGLTTAVS